MMTLDSQIGAKHGLTAEIDWNYTSRGRRCRKILIESVVRGWKTVVVRGKTEFRRKTAKIPK